LQKIVLKTNNVHNNYSHSKAFLFLLESLIMHFRELFYRASRKFGLKKGFASFNDFDV
jgi:hypothetical protein